MTIGKGQHSLRETPQSVSVLTRQLMDDQHLTTIDDIMERTPGITTYESPMGGKYFYSRGFKMLGQYQYDGVPLDMGKDFVQADSFSANMAIYDRVEVLKGAAGMLKGAGTASGAVNFVRKRPQAKPTTSLSLSAGTWDNYRTEVDTGGPLNDSGTVRGRAAVSQQTRGSYMDIAKRQDRAFYGALDIDLSPDTTLGVGASYEDVDATPCWAACRATPTAKAPSSVAPRAWAKPGTIGRVSAPRFCRPDPRVQRRLETQGIGSPQPQPARHQICRQRRHHQLWQPGAHGRLLCRADGLRSTRTSALTPTLTASSKPSAWSTN